MIRNRTHSIAVAAIFLLLVASSVMFATPSADAQKGGRGADPMASRRTAIVTAAQRVSPAVVSVNVISTRVVSVDPFGGMFRDEYFDRFFPRQEYRQRVPSLGSGVIVDASGMVLSNEHVVRNADEIKVTLSDGRKLNAKVLGSTPIYDLAVLQVEGKDLPVAKLGDSDQLLVGEWAIAIGSPFGYLLDDNQPTVTAGVVSATHRDVKASATGTGVYKDMIQTDAAINPGNSGGPLVNADGDVIGINAFIFTPSGGSIGLGFAIPINLAKRILTEVRTYGKVRRAYAGLSVQAVTPALARQLGFDEEGGLVVTRIDDQGPAGRAGIKVGDWIRKVNGEVANTVEEALYGVGVGDKLRLQIERTGQKLDVTVIPIEDTRKDTP
jgi:serine protease Do